MVKLKTILITGASGYVGSFLAKYLREKGYKVRLLVRQIPDYMKNLNLDIFVGDLTNKQSLVNSCKDIDVVVHAAALNETEVDDLNKAIAVNVSGTENMINIAISEGVKRLVKLSTFHVYGSPEGIISESTQTNPLHNYSLTQKMSEDVCKGYMDKIEIVILRISNGYGAPIHQDIDRWTLLLNDLCKQACLNNKIVLKSDGSQKRDFVCLGDISKAVEITINAPKSKIAEPIFNVGGENMLSIKEEAVKVSEIFFKMYKREIPIEYAKDLKIDKIRKDFTFLIEKIKKLGYKPISNMEEEVTKIIDLCSKIKHEKA